MLLISYLDLPTSLSDYFAWAYAAGVCLLFAPSVALCTILVCICGTFGGKFCRQIVSAGARIHSNSWGHAANVYDDYPRTIDEYNAPPPQLLVTICSALPALFFCNIFRMYVSAEAPDMLILFAAANQGQCSHPHNITSL